MAIMMSIAGVLPVELVENIFLQLEVKPLISLTVICKSWLAFIYSPSFIKAHLSSHSLNPKNQQMLLYKLFDDTIKLCPLNFTATLPISTVRIPVYFQRWTPSVYEQIICRPHVSPSVSFVGSVNGLVCLLIISKVRKYSVIIWNPATHRFKKIFDPDQTLCNPESIADTHMTLNLHCSVNDKFVMKAPRGRLFVYDIISKKIMDLGIGEGMHYEPINYAESLVAIEGMQSVRVKSAKRDKRLEYVHVTDVRRIENR